MSDVLLTPADHGTVVQLSRTLLRKKILPLGSIDYKGRKIVFDKEYLTDLASAFNDGAFDQVPAMVADEQNRHTMDPSRFGGECKGVEVGDDGLYGTFELSNDAAELVRKNPKLGVSARIVEDYARSDGKNYARAMQHVLLTLDPRIPGLGAWTEVSLSGYDSGANVVDLTSASFEEKEMSEKKSLEDYTADEIDALSEEELDALAAELGIDFSALDGAEGDEDTEETAEAEGEQPEAQAEKKEPAVAGASLSNDDYQAAIELSNANRTELEKVKAQLAAERYGREKDAYVAKGVPPAFVELARPLLETADPFVVELSNDNSVDATDVARKMLDSMVGYISLGREKGAAFDFANEQAAEQADPDEDILSKMKAAGL